MAAQTVRESERSESRGRVAQTHRQLFQEKSERYDTPLDRGSKSSRKLKFTPRTIKPSKIETSSPGILIDQYFLTTRFVNPGERPYFDPLIFNTSDSNIDGAFSSLLSKSSKASHLYSSILI